LGGIVGLPKEVYALFFVRLVVAAGSFVNPFLAMLLTLKLGYDEARAGAFMSAVSMISALGLFLGGKLGDALPRKVVLASLQGITALAYLSCAFLGFNAVTPFVIAFALAILSGTWPVINAMVADAASPKQRKAAFALLYWGNNIGFSMGPLVAGFLFARAPRLLFAGNALALVLAAGIVTVFIGERRRTDSPVPASSAPSPQPTFRVFLRDPTLALFAPLSALTAFVYNQHLFALPLFLADLLGPTEGPKAFGAAMTTNGLTVVACTVVLTYLARRAPTLLAMAMGIALYALGFGAYAFAWGVPFVIGTTVIWSLGEILGATNTNAFVAERAPAAHRSRVNGIVSFAYLCGGAAAPLASGPLMASFGSRAVWLPVGGLALLGSLAAVGLYAFDRCRLRTPI